MRASEFVSEVKGHDFMAGHCHVMAMALKQLHPDWQIRAHVGYDDDAADDTEYRVDHVYTVAPDGTAYDCRGRFDNEQQLVGPDTTGGVDTQYVNFGPEEIKQAMLRGELKRFTKQDLANAMQVATQAGKQDVSEAPAGYKEIEFVCVNPQFPDATDPALQKKMYRGLKQIDGVVPLWQEWGDYSEGQASLSAIYQDSDSRDKILSLAKQLGVEVDLEQAVSADYVDRAVRGEHEGQQGMAEGKKKKSSRSTGGYFFPGYGYYGTGDSGEGGGDGGGESVNRGMAEGLESLDDLTAAYQHHVELSRKYRKKGNREKDQHHTTQAFNIIQQIWEHPDYKLEFTDDPHSSQKNDALSMKHDSRFNEQGVAEGATVTRIDSKPVTDFVSGLKAYKHTDDWSQSGLDTGDDSYWKNKNLKTNTTKGLFAGDPRRTALYATGNAHETRYVEFTQNGQPIVYFDQKDLPAMRSRKTYLTVFDAGDFRQLPTGEWFSENPSKPIKQMPIGDPFKYIASQGWIVRVTDDLGKVFKQVKNMHKAGKIAHYGAEGMNESKQGVAEGSGDTIYPNAEVIKSKNGKPVGEIYQDGNSWGAFHYRADRGYDLIDSREEAIEALRELHQETGRSGPDYTIKGVAENFADGRNPQDKGDAKRHGINTKASVSSLRKTAKQGGRKGQLAHWLANMKSGRAKKK